MTGIAQVAFRDKANGSLIKIDGRVTGSALIGQRFTGLGYFHSRPSASDYEALRSGGTNYGPTNRKYIYMVKTRTLLVKKENNLSTNAEIPADIVLVSGSGLDPHISIESAMLQTARIATERKIEESDVRDLIINNTEKRYLGVFGDSFVNVLKLNIALDSLDKRK